MQMIADILLAAGALGAALYCMVLAGRLKRFNNLQNGMGGAVAVLSAQVDDMTKTLQKAQKAAATSSVSLSGLTERAEDVAKRLELMLAAMHDLPEASGRERGTQLPGAAAKEKEEPRGRPAPAVAQALPAETARVGASVAPPRKPSVAPPPMPERPLTPQPEPFAETQPGPGGDAPVFLSNRDHGIEAAE